MKKKKIRKVCFPIMNRIHYARQKHLLKLLEADQGIELQLIIGGSIVLDKYAQQFLPAIKKSGHAIHDILYNVIDGGNHVTMAKTAGLVTLEISNSLYKLNPDIVLIRGDRFEQLGIAMAAAYLNRTIVHIEGGDLTGTIDESVRHAITKLAHYHLVTNDESQRRVIQMGEQPNTVFNVGSPDVEFAAQVRRKINQKLMNNLGTGHRIDLDKSYIMINYHPVTTEKSNKAHTQTLLKAVDETNMQAIWFWPNNDAGTEEVSKAIRQYRELGILKHNKIRFITDVLPEDFIAYLKQARVLVGNSSSGIKECSYFGVPAVNVGTRQQFRLRGPNVTDVHCKKDEIKRAIQTQWRHGPYKASTLYYKKDSSKVITKIIKKLRPYSQKKFYEA